MTIPRHHRRSCIVDVADAKARLAELIERAAAGEDIILCVAGNPRARLVGLANTPKRLRIPGKGNGRFRLKPGFDEPMRLFFDTHTFNRRKGS